ncbi:TIGR02452 family protein [Paenibacillus farraposensis]|uniref:TIGR02452 family protein n=1 Tax=Paenibacillus farraposensis TaxID=2807095 RepID=A0ABW4DG15_9BACL|nr:TIGR02452 family protein [Paenibacillus farraposensis]MCC3381201.1 TIGR02452 family protein [Paenibacillus farraposensis]
MTSTMNWQSNRNARSHMAQETLSIVENGYYTNSQQVQVNIAKEVDNAITGSKLYTPSQLVAVRQETEQRIKDARLSYSHLDEQAINAKIQITGESTLQAACRLRLEEQLNRVACLNFASAKNPGGGFLGGSQAQEESLARSSALYPCISQMEEMYQHNRKLRSCFYSDYMIYSPEVPVFRDDQGALLEAPYQVDFLTAPAVNAGVVREREPEQVDRIGEVMLERIRYILGMAKQNKVEHLILGAYGCGVFRNKPEEVAGWFKQVLVNEAYGMLFDRIVFAVLDHTAGQRTLNSFKELLS